MTDAPIELRVLIDRDALSAAAINGLIETLAAAKKAKLADVVLRKDGRESRYEADWLKYAEIVPAVSPTTP